jgi:hypothetical protein
MNKDNMIQEYCVDILSPKKGYVLIRQMFNTSLIDYYREECERFLTNGRKIYARINQKNIFDYVHPRMPEADGTIIPPEDPKFKPSSYRIYQYFHNSHSNTVQEIFDRTLTLRNSIERTWIHEEKYSKEIDRLQSYVIVTKYVDYSSGLPKHRDYHGTAPYPLLQSLLFLSEPGVDYEKGDFFLYTKSGEKLSLIHDLKMQKGDTLFFDKSLYHEVEPIKKGRTTIGRWSVLIGARAPYRGKYWDRYRYSGFMMKKVRPFFKLRACK